MLGMIVVHLTAGFDMIDFQVAGWNMTDLHLHSEEGIYSLLVADFDIPDPQLVVDLDKPGFQKADVLNKAGLLQIVCLGKTDYLMLAVPEKIYFLLADFDMTGLSMTGFDMVGLKPVADWSMIDPLVVLGFDMSVLSQHFDHNNYLCCNC